MDLEMVKQIIAKLEFHLVQLILDQGKKDKIICERKTWISFKPEK